MIPNRADTLPSANRGPFVCGVLLGLSMGLAAGHLLFVGRSDGNRTTNSAAPFALWESMDSTSPESELRGIAADVEFSVLEVDPASDAGQATLSDESSEGEGGMHFFPEAMTPAQAEPPLSRNTQLAFSSESAAENPLRVTADVRSDRDAAPQALQPVPGAAPIDEQTSHREQLARRLIQEELPDATQQERDVWCDVLQGLPAEDIKGILRMRKRLGSGSSSALGGDAAVPGGILDPDGQPPIGIPGWSPPSLMEGRHRRTIETLQLLRELDRQNLLQRDTIGYKRVVPIVSEHVAVNDPAEAVGLRLLGITRDMSPGALRPTGRVLDVGIDPRAVRTAFLQVRRDDEVRYTRSGRLGLDDEGRLKILAARETWLLDPPIRIPDDAGELVIEADGRVLVTPIDEGDPAEAGRIVAAVFFNPAGLRAAGDGLYEATAAAGRPQVTAFGTASAGDLIQGHVESSNVDEAAVREQFKWQQTMMELLVN